MKYFICWILLGCLWTLGGWRWKFWRRVCIPIILTLLTFSVLQWWALMLGVLVWASTTLPYGTEKSDLPRWLCGILYAIPLIFIAYFTHRWFLWGIQIMISSIGSEWVNNWLNAKLQTEYKDRITEALTAFCAYCLVPFML